MLDGFLVSKETVVQPQIQGLMLETSAFLIFHSGNSTFINSFDKTKFLFSCHVGCFHWDLQLINSLSYQKFLKILRRIETI